MYYQIANLGRHSENGVKFCNGPVAPFGLCISEGHVQNFSFWGPFLCLLSSRQPKRVCFDLT